MAKDIFHDRERAEEAAYFSRQDAQLIAKLREWAKLGEIARALAEKLQVDDRALLDRLIKLGVTIDTGAAFLLAPLVEIAWADGHVSEAEQHAVLRMAQDRGVAPGSADMSLLLQWLAVRPPGELFQAALEAIKVGLSVLPRDEAEQRISKMIEACEQVAHSSGGLANLLHLHGRVSAEERSVLNAIRTRLAPTLENTSTSVRTAGTQAPAGIPDDIMQRLREANERFHHAGLLFTDADSMDLKERCDAANKVRAAEKEVEDVERQIHEILAAGQPAAS